MNLLSRTKKTFKRTRDVIKQINPLREKKIATISYEEWRETNRKYDFARNFLDETNPISIELKEILKEAEIDILENRLRKRHNYVQAGRLLTVFITPKKPQDDETVGQIKLIRKLFADVQLLIDKKKNDEKLEGDGKISIDRGK